MFDNHIKLHFKNSPTIINNFSLNLMKDKNSFASIVLKNPCKFTWSNYKPVLSKSPFNVLLNINKMELPDINPLLPALNIKINKGTLSGQGNASIENRGDTIKTNGQFSIRDLNYSCKEKEFKDIDFYQTINANFFNLRDLYLQNMTTQLNVKNRKAAYLRSNGNINTKEDIGYLGIDDIYVSAKVLNLLPIPLLKDILRIKTLDLTGRIDITNNKSNNNTMLFTDLKGDKLTFVQKQNTLPSPALSGDLKSHMIIGKRQISFDNFDLNLFTNKNKLGSLGTKGTLFIPLTYDKSDLRVHFRDLKLKTIQRIFEKIEGKFTPDLHGIDFATSLSADNSNYGKNIRFDVHTDIDKKHDLYSVRPIMLKLNGSNIFATLNSQSGKHTNANFTANCNFSNLDVVPILKTYKKGIYDNATGTINTFNLKMKGKELSANSMRKSLNGSMKTSIRNISMNDNTVDFDLLRLAFIPFEVLSQTEQIAYNIYIPNFLNNFVNYSNNIFSNSEKLKFSNALIDLKVDKGVCYFSKCRFIGTDDSFEALDFEGSIDLSGNLNLIANIKINDSFTIPLNIGGTVKNPTPDVISLVSFIRQAILQPLDYEALSIVKGH